MLKYNRQYYQDNQDRFLTNVRQYRIDNRDTINAKRKQYYKDNYDKINAKSNCECGGKFTYRGKTRHIKSPKHQNYLKSIEQV
jgi:hypothetical protein